MRHLSAGDYRVMPWANGKGTTVEMIRVDGPDGMLWRVSRASVVENGAFSVFAGIDRNLTVITGPGFDLVGAVRLRCDPLVPVSFAGDLAVAAAGVTTPCDDFNVMTARALPRPDVAVVADCTLAAGGLLAIYALTAGGTNGQSVVTGDLVITDGAATVQGRMIAVRLFGV